MKSLFWLLATVLVVGAAVTYARFGSVEPCGVVRQMSREADLQRGGLNALAASQLPDQIYDHTLVLRFGPLTPAKCMSYIVRIMGGSHGARPTGRPHDIDPVVVGREPRGLNEAE
jgi:hypothetical protein